MKVRELISELLKFNQEREVTITDGWDCICYNTNKVTIVEFKEDDGSISLDIGIGGNRIT